MVPLWAVPVKRLGGMPCGSLRFLLRASAAKPLRLVGVSCFVHVGIIKLYPAHLVWQGRMGENQKLVATAASLPPSGFPATTGRPGQAATENG
jgi:hypothetical protein